MQDRGLRYRCRMLAILTDHASTHKIDTVTTLQYDGVNLPAPDKQFDAVVSYAVLEHVQNEEQALSEIHRVLKEQGTLVISVPNKRWIFETHGARLPFLPWNRVPFFSWLPRSIHSRFAMARIYTKKEITGLLTRSGFDVLGSCYMTAPMDVVKSPRLQRLLRRVIFRNDVTSIPVLSTEIDHSLPEIGIAQAVAGLQVPLWLVPILDKPRDLARSEREQMDMLRACRGDV